MQKLMITLALGALFVGSSTVFAGGACCPITKAKQQAKAQTQAKQGDCWEMISKVDLTEDQKTRLAALKTDCAKTECTMTSEQKMIKGVKSILTPEQLAACKAECAKQGDKDCPMLKTEAKADKAS